MNMDQFKKPFAVKSLSLSGRAVMAPMTRSCSPDNVPGANVADYYRRRAENKVALIITEGTVVAPTGHGYPDVPSFYGKAALEGWTTVIETVHRAGGKIFPQLWHVGSVRQLGMQPDPSLPGYGPSAIRHPSIQAGPLPLEMSSADIESVIEAFSVAARHAEGLGFDGVEIHGAHGYLIDQFFWERTNQRNDRFGGDTAAKRTQFAVELIEGVRSEVDDDFPVCLRFSQWKLGDYDARLASTPGELEAFLIPLCEAGVDIFHCSTRRFDAPEFPGSELNLAGWTKKITGRPVITVGSVGLDMDLISTRLSPELGNPRGSKKDIQNLLDRMKCSEFDLVAMGRSLLADPEWVTKVMEDRFEEIDIFTNESLETLY